MSLSCLSHVKRSGSSIRPDAPPLYTDTVFHGDNSGSMSSMGSAPQKGAIDFGKEYKKLGEKTDHSSHLTFGVFSTNYLKVFSGNPRDLTDGIIEQFGSAMFPTNSTCFFDTTIKQIKAQQKRVLKAYSKLPVATRNLVNLNNFASVVFTIMTDGEDNYSTKYDCRSLRSFLLEHQEKYGAKIMFIAANMSAEQVGDNYGIPKGNCLQMGSDPYYAGIAMTNLTAACVRQSSQPNSSLSPPPPAFTLVQQVSSCSYNEYTQYNSPSQSIDQNGHPPPPPPPPPAAIPVRPTMGVLFPYR